VPIEHARRQDRDAATDKRDARIERRGQGKVLIHAPNKECGKFQAFLVLTGAALIRINV
jgi:hypothetical protein